MLDESQICFFLALTFFLNKYYALTSMIRRVKDGKGNVYIFSDTEDRCWIDRDEVASVLTTLLILNLNTYTISDN